MKRLNFLPRYHQNFILTPWRLIVFALLLFCCPDLQSKSVKVNLSSFMKSGRSDSECIRRCLEYCAPFEQKTIRFDVKELSIDEAILLESNTTIDMADCTIRQKDETFDNVFRGANVKLDEKDFAYLPDVVEPIHNVRILGNGNSYIIGPERNRKYVNPVEGEQDLVGDYYGLRTHQIDFSRLDGGEISGITFTKTRGWCLNFDFCSYLRLRNLVINSNVKNGDGIDFRVGCKHIKVENVSGATSDDLVACTALGKPDAASYPDGKYLFPNEATRRMRPLLSANAPDAQNIEDITIKNLTNAGTHPLGHGHGLICLAADGNKVRNIRIEHATEREGIPREAFIKIYTGYTSDGSAYREGDIADIRIKDVTSVSARFALLSNCKCKNVKVRGLKNLSDKTRPYSLTYPEGFEIK